MTTFFVVLEVFTQATLKISLCMYVFAGIPSKYVDSQPGRLSPVILPWLMNRESRHYSPYTVSKNFLLCIGFNFAKPSDYKLHRRHEMQTILTDVHGVCQSVYPLVSVMRLNSALLCKNS